MILQKYVRLESSCATHLEKCKQTEVRLEFTYFMGWVGGDSDL